MSESFEKVPEFPSEEKIISRLEEYLEEKGCTDCVEERRHSDEKRPSTIYWNAKDKDGDRVTIAYQRAGTFVGENGAIDTTLRAEYYMGDMMCGGDTIAEFKDGRWVSREG